MQLWWIVAAPLAGSLLLALAGHRLDRRLVGLLACASVGIALVLAILASAPLVGATFPDLAIPTTPVVVGDGEAAGVPLTAEGAPYFHEVAGTWFDAAGIAPTIGFWLDPLSALMVLVVTLVGFLIHVYAASYMGGDEDIGRFFAYMNFFIAAMLLLVLADNLLLLYVGWEGVGAASYLLIGFWYREPANGAAARKAFIVTRIGDAALAIALFILARELGTLQIDLVLERSIAAWDHGPPLVALIAALFLFGAIGKSAQLPLQVWLPDAMAGPTPVSALLHAATMVTAGVYLIARMHTLFLLAPVVLAMTAAIGATTAFTAACSALVQRDIKRVLAYSTISQIGYMFAALGVGAFAAAMFHLFTHAFFKALLFLSAGMVTHALHGETDIGRMGGLGRRLPLVAVLATIGAASLAGLPLVTAGFYSKDAILWRAYLPPIGGLPLWVVLMLTAGATALYSFRWLFKIFAGPAPEGVRELHRPGWPLVASCAILAVGAIGAGFLQTPGVIGGPHVMNEFLEPVFLSPGGLELRPDPELHAPLTLEQEHALEANLMLASSAVGLFGVFLAFVVYVWRPGLRRRFLHSEPFHRAAAMFRSGWYADDMYDALVVRPFEAAIRLLRTDPVDRVVGGGAAAVRTSHYLASLTQTGRLRSYAAAVVVGVVLLLTAIWWS